MVAEKADPVDEVFERFCLVLSKIPKGSVCSYGHLSVLAGLGGPRHTSRLLHRLPAGSRLPWHRIVNAQGKLANFSGADKQRHLLLAEGIMFSKSGIIPQRYFLV